MDIRDATEVAAVLGEVTPEVVVHTAGIIGLADDDPRQGQIVNVEGTRNVVAAARSIGAAIVFISSAAIFNGQEGVFSEQDTPASRGEYGKSKIAAEEVVSLSGLQHVIIRPSLVVGSAPYGMERVFMGRALRAIRNKAPDQFDADWRFTPSWTRDIATSLKWWLQYPSTTTKLAVASGNDPAILQAEPPFPIASNQLDTGLARRLGIPIHTLDEVITTIVGEELSQ
jgi:dTDP-4-dehydrorhamnose reductase